MRQPLWEVSSGALVSLLNSKAPLNKADLYTLTLADGTVYRWSGADLTLTGNSTTWVLGPGLTRTRVRFTVGLSVDSMTITITDNVGTTINGQPLLAFIRAGGLNGARMQVDKTFWGVTDTQPQGALMWFAGRIAEVPRINRYEAQITVKSDLELLDVMIPREVVQPGCLNDVYDSGCGASKSAKTVTGTTTSSTDTKRITFSTGRSEATGYFDLGAITMTSGANAGISRTIKAYVSGAFTVLQPWPFAVASGDTYSAYPGCNKSQTDANGCSKFHSSGNVPLRFRGQPYVPVPETVL